MYDKASIALIPSGYKDGELYSVLPANGDGDFTHTRGSTATRVNKDGLIETVATNVPRLDYPLTNGVVGDCPHLLLEPSRTNILLRSEQFDNSYWNKTSATITPNSTISPDGSLSADLFNINNPSGEDIVARTLSFSSGIKTNISIFVKDNDFNNELILGISSNLITITYDFLTETILSSTGSWLDSVNVTKGFNGFNRIDFTVNPTFNSFAIFQIRTNNQGNGSFYIWGAMFEAGSYATSYIPTSENIETRSADICNDSGTSAEFNDSEGVLFAEVEFLDNANTGYISVSDGTPDNRCIIYSAANQIVVATKSGGSGISKSATGTPTNLNKIAVVYSSSGSKFFLNGSNETGTGSFSTTPRVFAANTLDQINFDISDGSNDLYARVKQVIYFNEALSDSELQTLTS